MSLNFVEKVITIGGTGNEAPTLQFWKKGFKIGGGGVSPTWRDVILSGNTALTLVNSKANGLNWLRLGGTTEQVPQEYIDGLTLEGKCEQRNLPSEYTQVEYLESSGTQYIDTGYKSSNNTKVLLKLNAPALNTFVFGSRNDISGSEQKRFGLFFAINWNPQYGDMNYQGTGQVVIDTLYNVEMSSIGLFVDGTLRKSFDTQSFVGDYNMYLFANNTADTTIGYGRVKIYSFEIYNSSTLVRNLIPARRNSDNVLGMYDTVTGNFLTNAGTGDFTAGADVTPSPDTPMDIWCNNGVIKVNSQGQIYADGTQETVTVDTTGDTATAEMLLKVGDHQDVQSVLDGAVTRNVGIKVLDGTERWALYNGNCWAASAALQGKVSGNAQSYCTHYGWTSSILSSMENNKFVLSGTSRLCIKDDRFQTDTDFEQYIVAQYNAGTPVIVVYPLAEPTTEQVTPQSLDFTDDYVLTVTGSLDDLVATVGKSIHTTPTPTQPLDIKCNNGVVKVNRNLYTTEYQGYQLSQVDGVTTSVNIAVNVSGMVDCRNIKSFKITTISSLGSFRIFKYKADNTFINASSTANMGDIVTVEDNVGFFRIQYNFSTSGTGTQNILIYDSAYNLNETYTDGTVETVTVTGKNLFDKDAVQTGYYKTDGTFDTNSNYIHSIYIPVTAGTTYTQSGINGLYGGANKAICWYSEDYSYLSASTKYVGAIGDYWTFTATAPSNAKYMVICCATKDTDVQLELGSTATEYEPYFDGGSASAEMLLKVGTYKDNQEVLGGNVTRNVGIKVLDGSENIIYSSNMVHITCPLPVEKQSGWAIRRFCTHGKCAYATSTSETIEIDGNFVWFGGGFGFTVESCKQWLASQYANGTPVIVVYPLATATTETVTPQPLSIQEGTNIITAEGSIDNLPLEVSYKAGVSITITEVQNANLSNSVTVTIGG